MAFGITGSQKIVFKEVINARYTGLIGPQGTKDTYKGIAIGEEENEVY